MVLDFGEFCSICLKKKSLGLMSISRSLSLRDIC
nr:MAG TPA: hypothetical protein [Caudoviricetes sp.]